VISYQQVRDLGVQEFIRVLELCGLGSRRPIKNVARTQQMLFIADLIVTAQDENTGRIVGVARSLTEFQLQLPTSAMGACGFCLHISMPESEGALICRWQ